MMAAGSTWCWCRRGRHDGIPEMMASQRQWHPVLSGRQVVPRAGGLTSCVLSEPASAIPISANCTNEMGRRYLSKWEEDRG